MSHSRARSLAPILRKAATFSPIVGLFGHRQVGKTTLATSLARAYSTLDQPLALERALADPAHFLEGGAGKGLFVIDECQMAPPLFPALKEWVRTHPKPGQFLLTGSVRFSSRKAIRESLTGRIISWELLPMDLSEAHGEPLPDKISRLLKAKGVEIDLKAAKYGTPAARQKALSHGGLPGIFAVRDEGTRAQRFETMLETMLERDLRLVHETPLAYSTLRSLLQALALGQTQPLELTALSRKARISLPSLKRLLAAFQAMFLIRLIPTEGTEKKPVIFFEDQGEATHLSADRYDDHTQMVRLLFSQLRNQVHYRAELRAEIFQFRNRGGAHVPLCVRAGKDTVGLIPLPSENPSPGLAPTARSFFKAYPGAKLLYVHQGTKDTIIDARTRALGVAQLL